MKSNWEMKSNEMKCNYITNEMLLITNEKLLKTNEK